MRRKTVFWLAGAAGAAGVLVLAAWTPPSDVSSSFCLTRRVLGLPCPGCGLTRAVARLVQGDWAGAFSLHPLAPLVMLDAVAGWAVWGLVLYGLATPPPARAVQLTLLAQLAVFIALWLGRLATGTAPF